MNVNQFLQNVQKKSQNAIASLYSYKEYIDSKVDDAVSFMNVVDDSTLPDSALTLMDNIQINGSSAGKACAIKASDLRDALNSGSNVMPLRDYLNDQDIIVEVDNVKEMICNYISELRVQSSFLDYCFNHTEVSSTEMFSYVKQKVGTASSISVDMYEKMIASTRDPISALRNFVISFKSSDYNVSSIGISLVDPSNYTGSVISAAFCHIVDDVSLVINKIYEGITGVFTFFEHIGENLLKAGQWILRKAFGALFTRFESIKDNTIGILDIPIIQCTVTKESLCQAYKTWLYDYSGSSHVHNRKRYYWDGTDRVCVGYKGMMALFAAVYMWDNENVIMKNNQRVTKDVYISGNGDIDFVVRIGSLDNSIDEFIFQLYPVLHSASLQEYGSDIDIIDAIRYALKGMFKSILPVFPVFDTQQDVDDRSIMLDDMADSIIADNGSDNLVLRCKAFTYDLETQSQIIRGSEGSASMWDETMRWRGILLILAHAMISSSNVKRHYVNFIYPLTVCRDAAPQSFMTDVDHYYSEVSLITAFRQANPDYNSDNDDWTMYSATYNFNMPFGYRLVFDTYNRGTSGIHYPKFRIAPVVASLNSYSLPYDDQVYIPYSSSMLFPDVVHYQTTSEAAAEVVRAIRNVLLIAGAVYAMKKFVKWRRQRLFNTELAQAEVDALSWDIKEATDLNEKSVLVASYYKKRKKLNITYFINNALGIGDSAAGGVSLMSKVLDNISQKDDSLISENEIKSIKLTLKRNWN